MYLKKVPKAVSSMSFLEFKNQYGQKTIFQNLQNITIILNFSDVADRIFHLMTSDFFPVLKISDKYNKKRNQGEIHSLMKLILI